MSPRTVRTERRSGRLVQLGDPFRLPRIRWGHVPPRPVAPVPGKLDLFPLDDEDDPA